MDQISFLSGTLICFLSGTLDKKFYYNMLCGKKNVKIQPLCFDHSIDVLAYC